MSENQNPVLIALAAVLADAADLLGVPAEELAVEALTAYEWPDGCLGLGDADEACADVITPGFHVRLGNNLAYRTDRNGTIRREPGLPGPGTEVWVHFEQVGGIGGWSSEYRAQEGKELDQPAAARIRAFLAESDFFNYPAQVGNGRPLADLYRYTLTLGIGRRNHTVCTYDGSGPLEKPELADFLAWLKSLASVHGSQEAIVD